MRRSIANARPRWKRAVRRTSLAGTEARECRAVLCRIFRFPVSGNAPRMRESRVMAPIPGSGPLQETGMSKIRNRLRNALLVLAFAAAAGAAGADVPIPPIPATHPRILLVGAELARFQNDLATQRPAMKRFKEQMVDLQVGGADIYGYEAWYSAMMGVVTGQPQYCAHAVQMTDAFLDAEALQDPQRRRSPRRAPTATSSSATSWASLALVYDWCHANLTPDAEAALGQLRRPLHRQRVEPGHHITGASLPRRTTTRGTGPRSRRGRAGRSTTRSTTTTTRSCARRCSGDSRLEARAGPRDGRRLPAAVPQREDRQPAGAGVQRAARRAAARARAPATAPR